MAAHASREQKHIRGRDMNRWHLATLGRLLASMALCALLIPAVAVQAQTGNIYPDAKFAWSENAGWLNFRPTGGGVTVYADHLEGYAWAENIGWVRLGSYIGGGTHTYGNTSAADYGVNNTGGVLSGYGWSENAGWINFKPTDGGVTIDGGGKFSGYAWGENIGWVHFSNASPEYSVAIKAYATTPPDVTINQAAVQADPTVSSPITFTVVFSEAVTGFATGGVTVSGTANPTTVVVMEVAPNDGTTYNVAVSGMTRSGTVIATVAAGVAQDAAGNFNTSSTSTDNTVTFALTTTTSTSTSTTTTPSSTTIAATSSSTTTAPSTTTAESSTTTVPAAKGACDDWYGEWVVKYYDSYTTDNTTDTVFDNVIISEICHYGTCMDNTTWTCQARGRRASDNQTVMFGKLAAEADFNYRYYEKYEPVLGVTLYETIFDSSFLGTSFTTDPENIKLGLVSGEKLVTTTTITYLSTTTTSLGVSTTTTTTCPAPDLIAPEGSTSMKTEFSWTLADSGAWYNVLVWSEARGGIANSVWVGPNNCTSGICKATFGNALAGGNNWWWLDVYYGDPACGFVEMPGGNYKAIQVGGCTTAPVLSQPDSVAIGAGVKPDFTFSDTGAEWYNINVWSSLGYLVLNQWGDALKVCNSGTCTVHSTNIFYSGTTNWWWLNTYSDSCGFQMQPGGLWKSFTVQ